MKAYFGIGISKTYFDMISGLDKRLKKTPFDSITFIIADELKKECNDTLDTELVKKIEIELKRLEKIEKIIKYNEISQREEYKETLKEYFKLFETDSQFFKESMTIILNNRKDVNYSNLKRRAGYVLGQLSFTTLFSDEYIKIGPKTEMQFDNLSIKYPLDKKINANSFYYI